MTKDIENASSCCNEMELIDFRISNENSSNKRRIVRENTNQADFLGI
jgi:hypothetical protein